MKVTEIERCLKRILKEQTKDGFFPTYRTENKNNFSIPIEQEAAARIGNISLHSFIIEKLIKLFGNNAKAISSFKQGVKVILYDAVACNDHFLWRWLKNPDRTDYFYPPDYDDTARTLAIIETAKKYVPDLINYFEKYNKHPFELINQDYAKLLSKDLCWIGDDFKPSVDRAARERGILTFAREYGLKEHNEIDPVVNATVLYSYLIYLRNKGKENDEIVDGIKAYLTKFTLSEKFDKDFEESSRFFLSHALFSNILGDIMALNKTLFSGEVKGRLIEKMREYVPRNVLETALASGALLKAGCEKKDVKAGIEEITAALHEGIWEAYPFYQHKRLNHVFGSRAATSVFCLETLKLYGS